MMIEWISVEDRLPVEKPHRLVEVKFEDGKTFTLSSYVQPTIYEGCTHWREVKEGDDD